MAHIISIDSNEQQVLKEFHGNFHAKAVLTGCCTAAAAFLIIGALIVICCSCLCLLLPGINVINHVILPAVLPGAFAIMVSIPFILLAVKYNLEKNFYREQMIDKMITHLQTYKIAGKGKKIGAKFILHNFLNWQQTPDKPNKLQKNRSWTQEYQAKILGDIKDKIGKEKKNRNPVQEKIATALDRARAKLSKKK